MSNNLLMIFVKNMIPGIVKTRLAKDIGIDKALEIYRKLVCHTHQITRKIEVNKTVYYSDYIEIEDVWDTGDYALNLQKGNTLGEKMSTAFDNAFDSHNKVVIIGSDCYSLDSKIIKMAFKMLDDSNVVVGPAKDGGYYLLGMNEYFPKLFQNKTYSTSSVLKELLAEIKNLALSVHQLPTLNDIDTLADLNKAGIDWENLGKENEMH